MPQVITWSVTPRLVRPGGTTVVSWNVEHASSCSITGSNGDGTNGDVSSWKGLSSVPPGKQSGIISSQTIYTLQCAPLPGAEATIDLPLWIDQTRTVNIVPSFREN